MDSARRQVCVSVWRLALAAVLGVGLVWVLGATIYYAVINPRPGMAAVVEPPAPAPEVLGRIVAIYPEDARTLLVLSLPSAEGRAAEKVVWTSSETKQSRAPKVGDVAQVWLKPGRADEATRVQLAGASR
jgi:hypothetical protein